MDNQTILVVEDDEMFARVICRAMQQRGFQTEHAESVDVALTQMQSQHFDLAVLDLNLGGHSSLPLIASLKQRFPAIRILVLTGYASIATAVDAIKLGADNYLAKPADADEILAALLGDSVKTQEENNDIQEPMSVRRLEWEHIQKILKENDGNISETARQLKMHRRTLQRKLQKRPVSR
ncbi:MAG: response regulator transcription factor [Gammaproteobacteria bacterium]